MPSFLGRLLVLCGLLLFGLSASAETTADPIVIAFDEVDLARTYTGLSQEVNVTITPGTRENYKVTITYNGKGTLPRNVGTYKVRVVATEKDVAAPRTAIANATFVVSKAPLTVRADKKGRFYGSANPKLTFSYEGFLNGETSSVLTKKPVATTTAKTASPVGTYPITVVGGSDNNYEITTRIPADLTVVAFASGGYEAFVAGDFGDAAVGKIELTLPTKGSAFTGRLQLDNEPLSLAFKSALVLSPDYTSASATALIQLKPKGQTHYRYLVKVTLDGSDAPVLTLDRSDSPYTAPPYTERNVDEAVHVRVHQKTINPAPWAGLHTLSLLDPRPVNGLSFDPPTGAGYATASIGVDGKLTLKGKLADGTALTGAIYSDADGNYRLYLRPYGTRLESDFTGLLQLVPHPTLGNRYYCPLNPEFSSTLYWRKAKLLTGTDKTYPEGIEAIEMTAALDPWLPPLKAKAATKTTDRVEAITLAQRIGIAVDNTTDMTFPVAYDPVGDYGDSEYDLAYQAILTVSGKVVPNLEQNPTGWKMSINAATGVFGGSFVLTDPDSIPSKRKVAFQGILRQSHGSGDTSRLDFASGFFMLTPLEEDFLHTTPFSQLITLDRP